MNKWKSILVHPNQIVLETYKAILIRMPNNSKFYGYSFWVTSKLVKSRGGMLDVLYTDEFIFNLRKKGSDDKQIKGCDMSEYYEEIDNSSYYVETEPEKLELTEINIPKELLNE